MTLFQREIEEHYKAKMLLDMGKYSNEYREIVGLVKE